MKKQKMLFFLVPIVLVVSCAKKETKKIEENDISTSALDTVAIKSQDTIVVMPVGDNSQVSVDWPGTYEAILPCADCPGIKSILTLNKDKTFKLSEEYLERNVKNEDQGTFTWDKNGQKITLKGKETKAQYLVGENQLFHLDQEGKLIDGPLKENFIYKKK